MSEFKGTPGEWEVVRQLDYDGPSDTTFVEKIGPFSIEWHDALNTFNPDLIEADIALVAAAKDLLEALQTLAAEEYRDDDDPILAAARVKARAAICKALGEANE